MSNQERDDEHLEPPQTKRVPAMDENIFVAPELPCNVSGGEYFRKMWSIYGAIYGRYSPEAARSPSSKRGEMPPDIPLPVMPPIVLDCDTMEYRVNVKGARTEPPFETANINSKLAFPGMLPQSEVNIEVFFASVKKYCNSGPPKPNMNGKVNLNKDGYNKDNKIRPVLNPIGLKGVVIQCVKEYPEKYNMGYPYIEKQPAMRTMMRKEEVNEIELIAAGVIKKIQEDMGGSKLAPIPGKPQPVRMKPLELTIVDEPLRVDPRIRARNVPSRDWGLRLEDVERINNQETHEPMIDALREWSPLDVLDKFEGTTSILLKERPTTDKHVTILAGPLMVVAYESAPLQDPRLLAQFEKSSPGEIVAWGLVDECVFQGDSIGEGGFTKYLPCLIGYGRYPRLDNISHTDQRITLRFVQANPRQLIAFENKLPERVVDVRRDVCII